MQTAPRAICSFFLPLIFLAVLGFFGAEHLSGNFHAVVAGELYRSAQPDAVRIALYGERYGIRTIVNLRGENRGSPWYDAEVAEARRLGINHIDFRMSAGTKLTQGRASDLIELFRTARKPILIHCLNGVDRTGLAGALYVAAVAKRGEEAAESQMSLRYGHFPLPGFKAYAMYETFEDLEPWLGYH